ncbi:phosphatidate cytidylyltransferase [Capsulimonas corticalis]|uniref:Phosphatidate cytidylyltransferase n=1 Tax=Capsulimonas corticalis TaxID=2219043 RepID=A0A9N7L904_9BACT|nr:phosphatidate cytidylyltransferase [Capsulimonas corticalis]BDI33154.1 phosphatidate cytidylyltransferase [Capsulimonas corticalis]
MIHAAAKPSRPMLVRIGTGIVGALLYSIMIFLGDGLPFAAGVAVFAVLGVDEFYRAVRTQGADPNKVLGFLACIVFQYAAWTHGGAAFASYLPAVLMLMVMANLITEMVKRQPRPIISVGSTLLGAVYVGWLFSYLTLLRSTNANILTPPIHGTTTAEWLVVFVTATTWLSDAGALFAGRALGRNKLAPEISPAKTVEGSIGGLIASGLGGVVLSLWLHLPMGHAIILGVLCGFAGQIGDLCESLLKRELSIKDFGHWIPGHGGVLDRIDSLLFSAPLAFYYIQFFLINKH